jgi:hypothetical protein
MTTSRPRIALLVLTTLLSASLLAGCSDDPASGSGKDPSASSSSPGTGEGAGTPFASSFEGQSEARPGEVLRETLTNEGRLPDAYQVVIEPAEAAVVEESNFTLSPGESAEVRLKVRATPFDIHVKSVGGGAPDTVAMTVTPR